MSQVRSLAQADEYAREAVAFVLHAPPDSFDLVVVPDLPNRLDRELVKVRNEVARVEQTQREAAAHYRELVRKLKEAGLSGNDWPWSWACPRSGCPSWRHKPDDR